MYRKNYLLLLLVMSILCFPLYVSAHTGLDSSNPEANQTVQPTDTMILRFESKIEAGGRVQVSAIGSSDVLDGTLSQKNERMTLKFDQTLSPGQYQVDWKIVGTDGHPIEGTYVFTVAANKVEAEPQEDQTSVRTEPKKEEPSATTTRATVDSRFAFWIAGGILILLALYFFYRTVLQGRKR
ncbi:MULTISPECIES: copper resistance protein CopC [unclassified Exiguobacterium]|uniref:copper resistance CopC family protein n=1 Tax=unclassified Exiguobacterium TaxID=2644629 RepID=UPI001BE5A2B1|nr:MULTISPECIES: copper resistance protein CopC [unclassified Exiguobacterium]